MADAETRDRCKTVLSAITKAVLAGAESDAEVRGYLDDPERVALLVRRKNVDGTVWILGRIDELAGCDPETMRKRFQQGTIFKPAETHIFEYNPATRTFSRHDSTTLAELPSGPSPL